MSSKADRPSIRLYHRYHVHVILLAEQRTNNKTIHHAQTKLHTLDPLPVELETLEKFSAWDSRTVEEMFIRMKILKQNYLFYVGWDTRYGPITIDAVSKKMAKCSEFRLLNYKWKFHWSLQTMSIYNVKSFLDFKWLCLFKRENVRIRYTYKLV